MIKQLQNLTISQLIDMDLFTPENTIWETDDEGTAHLVYIGELSDLAKETSITEDKLQDLLSEYESRSNDLIDEQREIDDARQGNY